MCRTDQVLCCLGLQPPDMPRLCIASTGAVQEAGLHVLQGACSISALPLWQLWDLLTNARKEPQPTVVFTLSSDAPFSSYVPDTMPLKDEKLALSFETEEIMQESIVLLRFNCPDSSCDYTATGWNDLKLHARGVHDKFIWCGEIGHRLSAMV